MARLRHTAAWVEWNRCDRVRYDDLLEQRTPAVELRSDGGFTCRACWRHCSGNDLARQAFVQCGMLEYPAEQLSMFGEESS
ncbi:MAG: hypothetical protein HC893_00110 [Chloroflexaceae bacterium]|nr:hypothetical protein [Chloroflexaceae bacterium]